MRKLLYLSIVGACGFLTACNDLDTQPFSDVITEEQRSDVIAQDPAKMDAMSAGVYGNYNGFEMAYDERFDFGYPGIMIQLESRTQDFLTVAPDLYNWFRPCVAYTDNVANSAYAYCRWRIPYNTIYSANQVLGTIDDETEDETLKYYRAQALGNRAFSYWVLAQLYQFTYVGHESYPCVPIITDKNMNQAAAEGAPRATVQEVYDQILADLTEGIEMCQGNSQAVRADKRYIDINVLYALRARVYLCMQQYGKAADDALAVINSGKFTPLSSEDCRVPGFIELSSPNWVWGINIDQEDVHGLYTYAGMMGSYTYGYAYAGMWKICDERLWNRIPASDPRKLWWINPTTRESTANYYTAANGNAAAFLESAHAPGYAVVKFAPYGNVLQQSVNLADVPLIRIEEMYLILAEAQGMGGNLSQGKETLAAFVNNYRWLGDTPYVCNATSAEDFLDEVWFQRRVELWGEGLAYFDVMRLNKPIDRRNSNWNTTNQVSQYAYFIPAESPVLLTQIPTSVLDNNPALSDKDQNPTGEPSL